MSNCVGEIYFVRKQENYPDIMMPANMYFADFRKRIQQVIGLVEQMCYVNEGGKDKDEWNNYNSAQFGAIRRRMLDIADEVGSLTENIMMECPEKENDNGALFTLFSRKGRQK